MNIGDRVIITVLGELVNARVTEPVTQLGNVEVELDEPLFDTRLSPVPITRLIRRREAVVALPGPPEAGPTTRGATTKSGTPFEAGVVPIDERFVCTFCGDDAHPLGLFWPIITGIAFLVTVALILLIAAWW